MPNAFSVDVEDGISIAMRDRFETRVPQTDRVVTQALKILELLGDSSTKATVFVLGEVAEAFPKLVGEIDRDGHEIGVHGYNHIVFWQMKPDQARNGVLRAKRILEDITGKEIPALGGSYFRLLPYWVRRRILKSVEKERPSIVYLHPYELDSERYPDYYFEQLKKSSLLTQIRMRSFWIRRKSLEERYAKLLAEHSFCPIRDLISTWEANAASYAD